MNSSTHILLSKLQPMKPLLLLLSPATLRLFLRKRSVVDPNSSSTDTPTQRSVTSKTPGTGYAQKKACHGSLKTHLDSYEAIRSRPHTCKPLSQEECNLLTSEIDIVFDSSHTSTKELAALLHHPYSKNLSRRRWRKSRTSSTSSNWISSANSTCTLSFIRVFRILVDKNLYSSILQFSLTNWNNCLS